MVLAISAFTEISAPILLSSGPQQSSGTAGEKQPILMPVKVRNTSSLILNIYILKRLIEQQKAISNYPLLNMYSMQINLLFSLLQRIFKISAVGMSCFVVMSLGCILLVKRMLALVKLAPPSVFCRAQ